MPRKRLHHWLRRLHLYVGLFLCPFLVIFAISTIMLNHGVARTPSESVSTVPLAIPQDVLAPVVKQRVLRDMTQQQKVRARRILVDHIVSELGLVGEVGGAGVLRNGQTTVSVAVPGRTTRALVDVRAGEATVTVTRFGPLDTMRYLHLNPGPHRHPTSIITKAWGWIADMTVYAAIFLTISGVYMWLVIRAERKAGLIFLGAGCASFFAILYTLILA